MISKTLADSPNKALEMLLDICEDDNGQDSQPESVAWSLLTAAPALVRAQGAASKSAHATPTQSLQFED